MLRETVGAALLCLNIALCSVLPRWLEAQSPDPHVMAARLAAVQQEAAAVDGMPFLKLLCDRIGPRLTASVPARTAGIEVLAHMRELGLRNVHAEAWTLDRGWQRGTAQVSLITPFSLPIAVAAYGWTGSTPVHRGPVPVVLVDSEAVNAHLPELVRAESAHWRGKALLLSAKPHDALRAYAQLLPLLRAATAAHAIAVLQHDSRAGDGLVHTEPVSFPLPEHTDTSLIPALDLSPEHQTLLEDLLNAQQPVRVRIAVANRFTSTPVASPNFIGEIPGSILPEKSSLSVHIWIRGISAPALQTMVSASQPCWVLRRPSSSPDFAPHAPCASSCSPAKSKGCSGHAPMLRNMLQSCRAFWRPLPWTGAQAP